MARMGREMLLTSETSTTDGSSPLPAVPLSDQATSLSTTPPSSPPGFPWEETEDAPTSNAIDTPPRAPTSAFSLLGKRKALAAISENARPAKKVATTTARSPQPKCLTQMQISVGQEVQKKCKTCGMEYVPSSAEDRKLHEKYHKQNTQGYDVGKDFVTKTSPHTRFAGVEKGDTICTIDCFDPYARKRRGQTVLEIVQRELGAVEIPREDVWDAKRCKGLLAGEATYTAYLYVRGGKCIGFLLVQSIEEAYRVVEPPLLGGDVLPPAEEEQEGGGERNNQPAKGALSALKARQKALAQQLQQPIQLSRTPSPAQLGVSRIWTSPTHRHQNIATTLLDTAFHHHNNRCVELGRRNEMKHDNDAKEEEVEPKLREIVTPASKTMESKDAVAFSQPTEAGVRLARRWFGREWGWGVYIA